MPRDSNPHIVALETTASLSSQAYIMGEAYYYLRHIPVDRIR